MSRQLALRIGLPDLASFDNFYPGGNRQAVAALRDMAAGRPGVMYLHGGPGTGKSHLLYAATKLAQARQRLAVYVSRRMADAGSGDWLDLPGTGLVCVDDLDGRLATPEATALFALYERQRAVRGSLVIGSRAAPAAVDWVLPDLRSRIQGDLLYHLAAFSDPELAEALRLRAAQRGIVLSDAVIRYVLNRYERSPAALFGLLDRIDSESLARQRRVTVPFLRSLEAGDDDPR